MDYKCPACGADYRPGEKFCQNCGAKLPTEAPAAPVYAAPVKAPAAPTYETPAAPVEAPAAPTYQAPAAPVYNAPAVPMYQQPAAPVNNAPAAPAYQAPAAPAYQQPAAPAYENKAPAAPVNNAPAAPMYRQPAAPTYQAPAAPAASGFQPAPGYAQAQYNPNNTPDAAPKKKKTGLIIGLIAGGVALLAIIAVVLLLVLSSSSPDSVSLSETSLSLEPWESTQLTATILPEKASEDKLTWATSDEDVATVYDGYVTAWGTGTCTITVTTSNGKTATCYVTVEEEAVISPTEATEATTEPNNIETSTYDSYILGEWKLIYYYDFDTSEDIPVEQLNMSGKIVFNADHTARVTTNGESTDFTWEFDEVDDWGDYCFWLDNEDESLSFDYIVDDGEIWLYLDDTTLTYER